MSGDVAAMLTTNLGKCPADIPTYTMGQRPDRAIYLDIDGVLVTDTTRGRGVMPMGVFYYLAELDPECCTQVVRIIRATGARVVLCSEWRKYPSAPCAVRKALYNAGLTYQEVREVRIEATKTREDGRRWCEINDHLTTNPGIKTWVWLDDNGGSHRVPQICSYSGGLQDKHVAPAVAYLRGEYDHE